MAHSRLGADVGGTFTDFVLTDDSGEQVLNFKTPSTPSDPAQAILAGIQQISELYDVATDGINYFVHGTTLGVNTLIQRTGSVTGLLVTKGFRDVLEIGRLRLPDPTNYFVEKVPPLAPRKLVREIDERLLASGEVLVPLDLAEVHTAVEELVAAGVQALGISFMHSYKNDAHEREAAEYVKANFPDLYVCGSTECLAAAARVRAHADGCDQCFHRRSDDRVLLASRRSRAGARHARLGADDEVERGHHDRRVGQGRARRDAALRAGVRCRGRAVHREAQRPRPPDRVRHGRDVVRRRGHRRRRHVLDRELRRLHADRDAGGRRLLDRRGRGLDRLGRPARNPQGRPAQRRGRSGPGLLRPRRNGANRHRRLRPGRNRPPRELPRRPPRSRRVALGAGAGARRREARPRRDGDGRGCPRRRDREHARAANAPDGAPRHRPPRLRDAFLRRRRSRRTRSCSPASSGSRK